MNLFSIIRAVIFNDFSKMNEDPLSFRQNVQGELILTPSKIYENLEIRPPFTWNKKLLCQY